MAASIMVLAQETVSDKKDLYPHANELVVGALAFAVLFVLMWKFVLPRVNQVIEERRRSIQGQLEQAEKTREEAESELADYRARLANAREEANRIIEEARKTADQLRRDIQAKAEEESGGIIEHAQDEIGAERDRVFQELRSQVGEIAVELAGRVVNEELDTTAHERLIDEYIASIASGNGKG